LEIPQNFSIKMSVNYGAQASRIPGNAGGAAFSPRPSIQSVGGKVGANGEQILTSEQLAAQAPLAPLLTKANWDAMSPEQQRLNGSLEAVNAGITAENSRITAARARTPVVNPVSGTAPALINPTAVGNGGLTPLNPTGIGNLTKNNTPQFSPYKGADTSLASRGMSGGVLRHGGTIAPNVDLHHASVGVTPQHLQDASLASRTPTNPTPGPLVSQNSTFSQLPTAVQDAMRNLGSGGALNFGGGNNTQNSWGANVTNPAMNAYLAQASTRLQQQNQDFEAKQQASAAQAWKTQLMNYESSRPKYGMPANLPTAPALNVPGSTVRQAPEMALPTY